MGLFISSERGRAIYMGVKAISVRIAFVSKLRNVIWIASYAPVNRNRTSKRPATKEKLSFPVVSFSLEENITFS